MANTKETGADRLVETMLDWGIDTVFGIPGDGINGIIESLRRRQDRIKFIQVRHEEVAAFACVGDAKISGAPVLAITGDTFHDLIGTHYQQDVDLNLLFKPACVYTERVMGPAH